VEEEFSCEFSVLRNLPSTMMSTAHRLKNAAAAILIGLYGVLAVVVRIAPLNGIDRSIFEWATASNVPFQAYPSGHTPGTIIQYALGSNLVVRLALHRCILAPLVALPRPSHRARRAITCASEPTGQHTSWVPISSE
jgi:hypothetical protein